MRDEIVTLRIEYDSHDRVQEIVDILTYIAESISLDFDRWDEPHTSGPGLYFAVVSDHDYGQYADPMGSNTWPVDDCRLVDPDDQFYETTRDVAFENDGAVVLSVDGVIQEQMVRLRDLDRNELTQDVQVEYEDWMGSRHMSAVETSVRPSVIGTITLSEETGRVSVFTDGSVRSFEREELGGPWRYDR